MTKLRSLLPFGIFLIGLDTCFYWTAGGNNTYFSWAVGLMVVLSLWAFSRRKGTSSLLTNGTSKLLRIYLLYVSVQIVRGLFVSENYWDYKNLVIGSFTLLLPCFVYAFARPATLSDVLRSWLHRAFPLFFLFIPFLPLGAYHFCLGPLFLIACFLPMVRGNRRVVLLVVILAMLVADLDARSQVIKAAVALLCCMACIFRQMIANRILRVVHWAMYLLPVVLLLLGTLGVYNVFDDMSSNKGKYTAIKDVDGEKKEVDLSADTRTFIYEEVISSAVRHNYIVFGRSPARGNDSFTFGSFFAEDLHTGRYERFSNELCHTNVFTWIGLVGLILYSAIYLLGSFLAVYRSRSFYLKLAGVFIAFHWAYGWVEDINRFDISNVGLWMVIAMGLSSEFRNMTNEDFKSWLNGICIFRRRKPVARA